MTANGRDGAPVGEEDSAGSWLLRGAIGALAVAGIVALWVWSSGEREGPVDVAAARSMEPLGCTLTPGAEHSFDLNLSAETKIDSKRLLPTAQGTPPPPIQSQRVAMRGQLHLRVLEAGPDGSTWSFWLEPDADAVGAGVPEQAVEQLKKPVVVEVTPLCEFTRFGFAPDVENEVRDQLRGILLSSQIVLAKNAGARSWQHLEYDMAGRYAAHYQRKSGEPRTVTKTKAGYLEVYPPRTSGSGSRHGAQARITVRVRKSDTRARWASADEWIERLASVERLLFMADGHVLADVYTALTLERRPSTGSHRAPALADLRWVNGSDKPEGRDEAKLEAPPDEFKTMSLDEALARARALIDQRQPDHAKAGKLLAMLMRAQPGLAAELMQRVRDDSIASEMHSAVFFGLEQAGTPEARAVLVEALDDPGLQPANRMRAAAALPDIAEPDEGTLDALDRLAAAGPGLQDPADAQRLENAATFALGTLEQRVRDRKPELAERARSAIRDHLRSAQADPVQVTAAIDAIYNSGHPDFLPDLKPHFESSHALVRSHAYEALKHMPMDASAPLFESLLAKESEPQQRALLAVTYADQAKAARTAAPTPVWQAAADRLGSESNTVVRASYVHLIGTAAKSSPDAMRVLAEQYARETDPRMLRAIGQYVPADQLP